METVIEQVVLSQRLGVVSRAVSPRSTLPVLGNVLIKAEGEQVELSATNLEMGIVSRARAEVKQAGAITVPHRLLSDLVATLPPGPVKLTTNDTTCTLTVQAGKSRTEIKGIDAQEFPPMPAWIDDTGGVMAVYRSDRLKEWFTRVIMAASTDEARPVLQGVHVARLDKQITLSATDGFRISVVHGEDYGPADKAQTAILPARTLAEVIRCAGKAEDIYLEYKPGQAIFQGESWQVVSQMIDGNFPDHKTIMPKSFRAKTEVSTAALLSLIKQADVIAKNGNHAIKLTIAPDKITAEATSEDTGNCEGSIEATGNGPEMTIAFNVQFLRDAVEIVTAPTMVIETNDHKSPARLSIKDCPDWQYVIMPLHLG